MPALKRTLILPSLAILALAASTLAAHADIMQDFTVDMSTYVPVGLSYVEATIQGTVDVDFTNDLFTTGDLTYTEGGTTVTFNKTVTDVGQTNSPATISFLFENNSENELNITLPGSSVSALSGYSGTVCAAFSECGSYISSVKIDDLAYSIDNGTFDLAIAPTPEPSSLVLVCTGLFGVAGMLRRKRLPIC